jgi:thiosulfate/3-mercaptopyruvate sulfurtransferase
MLDGTDTSVQSLIVDPGWLVDRRSDPVDPPLIVDLSSRTQYETEHIPGAVHGWWQDGMELHAPSYGELLSDRTGPLARQRWLQSLGITRDATIVVYDDSGGRDAARLVWMLGFMGIDSASVLNGGLAAWKSFGLPVTSTETSPPDVEIISPGQDLAWLLATDELARRLGDPSLTIVDIRSDAETRDDLNDTIRIGRLPRSISLPWTSLYEDDGVRMRSLDQLTAIFTAAGLAPEDEILLYGRFGMDTGRVWLALAAAGYSRVRIYDEGWVYWASRDDLPIDPLPDDTVIYASTGGSSRRDLS